MDLPPNTTIDSAMTDQEQPYPAAKWCRVRRSLLALSATFLLLSFACLNGARHTNRLLMLVGVLSLLGGLLGLAVGVILRPLRKGR